MPRFMVRRKCSPEQHYWIGSPEQLPACGGLPVDRTGLPEGGLYVSQLLRPRVYTSVPVYNILDFAKEARCCNLSVCVPKPTLAFAWPCVIGDR